MKKREREESSSEDEDYAAREQFVRDNATSMKFEELVEKFLEKFKLKNRSSAFDSLRKTFIQGGFNDMVDRLNSPEFKTWWKDNHIRLTGVPKLLEKETRKVQVRAIMSGSNLLQTGISAMTTLRNLGKLSNGMSEART
ncbi:hypothetical protein BGZ82_002089 [Podila clonocystis]|nr:hypothetical protein BGZ82_002089 [Podila clonocystis]